MKAFNKTAFTAFFLLVPFFLQGAEYQVKVIKSVVIYLKNFVVIGRVGIFFYLMEKTWR